MGQDPITNPLFDPGGKKEEENPPGRNRRQARANRRLKREGRNKGDQEQVWA